MENFMKNRIWVYLGVASALIGILLLFMKYPILMGVALFLIIFCGLVWYIGNIIIENF